MNKLNLVLFAGGKGTRLGSVSHLIPKPMVKIKEIPLIHRVINLYEGKINKCIICAGYLNQHLVEYFSEQEKLAAFDFPVHVVDTGEESGTAYRLKLVENLIDGNSFFLNYSDAISDINIKESLRHHQNCDSILTIGTVNHPTSFGVIEHDEYNTVTSFAEKQPLKNTWINGGFFVCNTSIFKYLKNPTQSQMFEDSYFIDALIKTKKVKCYKHSGFWRCVDTVADLRALENHIK